MGWTSGHFEGTFTARAAIAFDFGEAFTSRIVDAARYGNVIYAAIRSLDGQAVFGLVLLTERRDGLLYTKSITEDMGPAEDGCPERILNLLTEPSNDNSRDWRERCWARLSRPRPRKGQAVVFAERLRFENGEEHQVLVFQGGSRFRSLEGTLFHVSSWEELDYSIHPESDSTSTAA
jgi:hypothetical protein